MKKIAIIFFVLAYSFSSAYVPVRAYDQNTTHPALTNQIVEFYNASFPGDKLTLQQKEWVVQGSIDEDESPRWINHFYDPVNDTGWTGDKTGSIPAEVVRALRAVGITSEKPIASVNWAGDEISQSQYLRYGGNFTWARGIRAVAEGDEERAYKTLGHALHLLEDATVPEHSRDDTHAHIPGDEGSPYETYASRYTRGNFTVAKELVSRGIAPDASFTTIQEAIKKAAEYSNHYFFSKDTINDPKYEFPKITREDDEFGYATDEQGKEFPLVKILKFKNEDKLVKNYSIGVKENYYPILEAYFSRLSQKSVVVGAGVVRLFQKQKADAIVNKDYPVHIGYYDPEKLVLIPGFSFIGEYEKAKTATTNAALSITNTISEWYTGIKTTIAGIFPSPQPASIADALPRPSAPPTQPNPNNTGGSLPPPTKSAKAKKTTPKKNQPPPAAGIVKGDFIASPQPTEAVTQNHQPQTTASPPQSIALIAATGGVTTLFSGSTAPLPGDVVDGSESSGGGIIGSTIQSPPQWKLRSEFSSSTAAFNLSWDEVPVVSASSSILYQIFDDDVSTSTPVATTTKKEAAYSLQEVGRPYHLRVIAIDENGVTQQQASTTVAAPGLLKVFAIYPDTRRGKNQGAMVLEIEYDNPDFLPHLVRPSSRQGLIFFRNQNPVEIPIEITTQIFVPNNPAMLPLQGKTCTDQNTQTTKTIFILPFSTITNCQDSGNAFLRSSLVVQTKGNHIILPIAAQMSNSDFVTIGLYEEGKNPAIPKLVQTIKDVTHYTPQQTPPPHEPPTTVELSAALDLVRMSIKASWTTSTDPDSRDEDIAYQIQLTTSTISEDGWQEVRGSSAATLPVQKEDKKFTVAVRAVDEFGNSSPSATKDFTVPDGFVPYIQSGSLNSARQEFTVSQDADIASISIWTNNFTTDSRNPATNICSLEILDMESTSTQAIAVSDTPNPQDGESDAYQYRGSGCAGDLTFTFAGHPRLFANHRYAWFFHLTLPITLPVFRPGHGQVQFFGKPQNTTSGTFSDPTITNAKFMLLGLNGTIFEN